MILVMISIYIYTHKPFKPPFRASNEFKILTDDKSVKSDMKVLYEQDFNDNLMNLSKFYEGINNRGMKRYILPV